MKSLRVHPDRFGFFRCTSWQLVAENAAHSLKKGMRIVVAGKLLQRTFEVDGNKRTVVEIQATQRGTGSLVQVGRSQESNFDRGRASFLAPEQNDKKPGFGRASSVKRIRHSKALWFCWPSGHCGGRRVTPAETRHSS